MSAGRKLRVQILEHVPFEGIGSILPWMDGHKAAVRTARLYDGAAMPRLDDFNWLIVMGGPMSVNEEKEYAWLRPEKSLIARAVEAGKVVLGICLGAQLVASALSAKVHRNPVKEIGWFPVRKVRDATAGAAAVFPSSIEAFHWHGETFDLPHGAARFLESDACPNQAFSIGARVVALQFHLETTPESANLLIDNCWDEIKPAPTIQSAPDMMAQPDRFQVINRQMDALLSFLAEQVP